MTPNSSFDSLASSASPTSVGSPPDSGPLRAPLPTSPAFHNPLFVKQYDAAAEDVSDLPAFQPLRWPTSAAYDALRVIASKRVAASTFLLSFSLTFVVYVVTALACGPAFDWPREVGAFGVQLSVLATCAFVREPCSRDASGLI